MPLWLAELFQALSQWRLAEVLRETSTAYLFVNAAHILSLGLIVGSICTLDLRMLGLFRAAPLDAMAGPLSRVAAAGVALAIATGFLLFIVRPAAYVDNPAFLAKIALTALGIVNALALHRTRRWRMAVQGGTVHGSVKLAAAMSLLIWAGAVLAGRWIGFLQ